MTVVEFYEYRIAANCHEKSITAQLIQKVEIPFQATPAVQFSDLLRLLNGNSRGTRQWNDVREKSAVGPNIRESTLMFTRDSSSDGKKPDCDINTQIYGLII